jgi:hypothetical protein
LETPHTETGIPVKRISFSPEGKDGEIETRSSDGLFIRTIAVTAERKEQCLDLCKHRFILKDVERFLLNVESSYQVIVEVTLQAEISMKILS